jgi:hypothetical protein
LRENHSSEWGIDFRRKYRDTGFFQKKIEGKTIENIGSLTPVKNKLK